MSFNYNVYYLVEKWEGRTEDGDVDRYYSDYFVVYFPYLLVLLVLICYCVFTHNGEDYYGTECFIIYMIYTYASVFLFWCSTIDPDIKIQFR